MVETLLDGSNPEEFLEHTKLELFQDQVFCFTPKGRLIALATGSHTARFRLRRAHRRRQRRGRRLRQWPSRADRYAARNGDEVDIQTSKAHSPPAAWEGFAVTGRARSAIRRAARDGVRRQYAELGRRLLTAAFDRVGSDYSDDKLKRALPRLSQKSIDDVLAAVARSELQIDDVLKAALPDVSLPAPVAPQTKPRNRFDRARGQDGWFNLAKGLGLKFRVVGEKPEAESKSSGVPIRGWRNDVPVTFEEGGAVPGDRIVGVLTPGEGIRVFQIHSPRLKEHEEARWIDVTWDIDPERPERFPAHLRVTALNEPGTLAEIAKVIGETDGNIDNLRMMRRASDFTEMHLEVEVWDLEHLNRIIAGLKSKASVAEVERAFG